VLALRIESPLILTKEEDLLRKKPLLHFVTDGGKPCGKKPLITVERHNMMVVF
jgi:hypothetical protein